MKSEIIHQRAEQAGKRLQTCAASLQCAQRHHRAERLYNRISHRRLHGLFEMSLRILLADVTRLELLWRHGRLFLHRLCVGLGELKHALWKKEEIKERKYG